MSTAHALLSSDYTFIGQPFAVAAQAQSISDPTAPAQPFEREPANAVSDAPEESGTHASVPEAPRPPSGSPQSVDLDTLTELLNAVPKPGTLRGAARLGQLIVRYYYDSDHELARSRCRKPTSIRKLAAHARLDMSPTSLSRAVRIHQLSQRMPQLLGFEHIGVGHVSSCFALDPASQISVLERAEREQWTRKYLNEFIAKLPAEQKPFRRGR